jgi:hypothetical protein
MAEPTLEIHGIAPNATPVAASSLVLKDGPGALHGLSVSSGATAGYVMLFDAVAAPDDGVTTPKKSWVLAADSSLDIGFNPPLRFATGITAVYSSTGPFTKTASATAFISGEAV